MCFIRTDYPKVDGNNVALLDYLRYDPNTHYQAPLYPRRELSSNEVNISNGNSHLQFTAILDASAKVMGHSQFLRTKRTIEVPRKCNIVILRHKKSSDEEGRTMSIPHDDSPVLHVFPQT